MRRFLYHFLVFYVFLVILTPQNGFSQYFGRNKVNYENFNFRILRTTHFDLYHYLEDTTAVMRSAESLEKWYGILHRAFKDSIERNQPIILYSDHADFQQTNVINDIISQGTGGVTEGLRNRIVIPLTGVRSSDHHVLGHELVHAFQFEFIHSFRSGSMDSKWMPLWFIEGMAEYLSIGSVHPHTAMWMRDAVLHDDIPNIRQMSESTRYFPYRYGHALWAYLGETLGNDIVHYLYIAALRYGYEYAFQRVLGVSPETLSAMWRESLEEFYTPQVKRRMVPSALGKRLSDTGGDMNLSPSISPHGQYVAFLSNRDVFTIDLYIVDAGTGEVVKKLVSGGINDHFDALSFMHNAGAWSPDGDYFASVVFREGDTQIILIDVQRAKIQDTIPVQQVDAIRSLSWSPDGHRLLFSGISDGLSNLYLYDLSNRQALQITDNHYAEIQPTWSPDGRHIAFATDRGLSARASYEQMNLALMDIATREIEIIRITDGIKHINPRFSGDGRYLYFIADPDGFSDIYRYRFSDEFVERITNVLTGISGLTALSPAMSMSHSSNLLAFSVFEKSNYHIHLLDPDTVQAEPYQHHAPDYKVHASLPPYNPSEIEYSVEVAAPESGISGSARSSGYSPSLDLLYVGQPGIGFSFSRFGTYFGGGVNMLFGDMLGHRLLAATVQANGSWKDLGGQISYQNKASRFNWGGAAVRVPYRMSIVTSGLVPAIVNGNEVIAEEFRYFTRRIFIDQLQGIAEYPINRNRRWELAAGYTRIGYDYEQEVTGYYNGQIIYQWKENPEAPDPLHFLESYLAYVGDYSFSGFTGPVRGKRFRFEIGTTQGSLQYYTLLSDYRHYFFVRPLTFAFRFFHYGRYMQNAENARLSPIQLGYPVWVRGYAPETFHTDECHSADCVPYEDLIGSKVGIFNAEFRLPVLGTEQLGMIPFRYLPLDVSLFFDAGIAWQKDELPKFLLTPGSANRIPVFSAGIAARFNLFGYLVGQIYYVYPFQRPNKGFHLGFVLAPGW